MDNLPSKRIGGLTIKGQIMLDEKLQKYTQRLERAWEDFENVLVQSGACEKNPERTEGSSQKSLI